MWWNKVLKFFGARRSPLQLLEAPYRTFGGAAGVFVNEDSSLKVSAFYRGVMYISTQIAKLPWEVKDTNNQIIRDPASKLIGLAPNMEMDAVAWRLSMVQSAIIHGNSYSEIERDITGRPVAMHFIPSINVEPMRDPNGALVYRVIGGSARVRGEDVYLPARDVFHLKNSHTKDGVVGQGVCAFALQSLGIALGADRLAASLFENGGMPSGVLQVPGSLSDEAFARIKDSWKEQHSGRKSGGVAVLEEGTLFKETMFQPDVMQFLESRKFNVLEIARFLGLPPTKLFDTSVATYNNLENANLEVATDTLDFWARNLEIQADIKLLNYGYGGKYTEMDLYSVFRGDMKTRADYFGKMMSVGAITPNEIRSKEGLPPYAEGDEFYIANNNYAPARRINEIIDADIEAKKAKTEAAESSASSEPEEPETESDSEGDEFVQAAIKFLERH